MSILFNDFESEQDYLGYEPYIKAFSHIIKSEEEYFDTPLVIGIHGKWGSGKSTFMNLLIKEIDNDLEKDNYYKIIRINSWQFDGKSDFISTLFREIYEVIKYDSLFSNFPELKIKLTEILKNLEVNVKIPYTPISAKIKRDEKSVFKKEVNVYRRELIENIINEKYFLERKFIVFIDDLDRCSVENVIDIIEDIKLSLNSMKCIFFLGCDLEYLKSAVANKYKDIIEFKSKLKNKDTEEELIEFCNEYLEKVIQIPFNIPYLDITNMGNYLNNLIDLDKEYKEECNNLYINIDNKKLNINDDIKNLKKEIDVVSKLFFKLRVSARKIKRIMNQAFLHNIFIKFNCINDGNDIDAIKPDLVILILLLTLKDIYSDYYNEKFWCLESAKISINKWNIKIKEENQSNIDDEEIPEEVLEFLKNLLEKRNIKEIEIEDKELEKYLNVTNTVNFEEIEPKYFKIKSSTGTNKYVRNFCQRNKYNQELMRLIRWFFEEIYNSEKLDLGIANNIMIYKKDNVLPLEKRFLFAFYAGMQDENSYLKLKYRSNKCCLENNYEDSIAINNENIDKIKDIIKDTLDKI